MQQHPGSGQRAAGEGQRGPRQPHQAGGQAGQGSGPDGSRGRQAGPWPPSGSHYRAGRPMESRMEPRQRTGPPGPGQALTRSQERA